jgi:hypothetical protein
MLHTRRMSGGGKSQQPSQKGNQSQCAGSMARTSGSRASTSFHSERIHLGCGSSVLARLRTLPAMKLRVVDVIIGTRHDGMISAANENRVAVPRRHHYVAASDVYSR